MSLNKAILDTLIEIVWQKNYINIVTIDHYFG